MKSNNWIHQKYTLHYYTAGEKTKPCIIFLHGFMGSGYDWRKIIDLLSPSYYCIAPDLPGHGNTIVHGSDRDYEMVSITNIIPSFLRSLDIERVSICGYSMGGRLALFLAVTLPNLWEKLILESVSPGLRSERERQERLRHDEKLAKRILKENLEDFLGDWYQQPFFKSIKNHPDFNKLLQRRSENNPLQLAVSLRRMSLGRQPSLWQASQKIEIPVLLIAGEFDNKFRNILSELSKVCPTSDLEILKKAGHNSHFEQPLAFYEQIDKFLKSR